ncbi:hypothetical protein [Micromonospora sp. NPDC023737]|uniref:hypothetical protein n=1 Tax=unclassified Micromonospora TaxID=2617518 RepID=UPI0033E12DEB
MVQRKLADQLYSGFTDSSTVHGGQEATHPGADEHVLPRHHRAPCYPDPIQFPVGQPLRHFPLFGDGAPGEVALQTARDQARRVADMATLLKISRAG